MFEIVTWKTSEALCNPYGILLKRFRLKGVLNVSNFELLVSAWIYQYSQLASNVVKTFLLDNLDKISSVVGRRWWWPLVALLRSEESRQILNLPFGLSTITIELTHSEDSEIGTYSIMSSRFILSSSCLKLSFNAIVTCRGAWMTE